MCQVDKVVRFASSGGCCQDTVRTRVGEREVINGPERVVGESLVEGVEGFLQKKGQTERLTKT